MISCWWLCGGAAGPDSPGHLGWSIPEKGFGFVAELFRSWVLPHLRAIGVPPRLFLHNPFGLWPEKTGTQMTIHQERLAEADDRLDFAIASFQPAFMPLIKEGVEVVCYVGPDIDNPTAKPSTRWNQLHSTFNRIITTGCSVAFDMLGVWTTTDQSRCEPRLARLLQSLGVRVYGEGAPILPEWIDVPIIIDTTSSNAWRAVDPTSRKAETILRIDPKWPIESQIEASYGLVKRGFSVAIEPLHWREHGSEIVKALRPLK